MAPATRRSEDTRAKILDAAAAELSERGEAGMRIEHVARRAGCNKALVYRYFGDRETLVREALRAQFAARSAVLDVLPETLGDALSHWTRRTLDDPVFVRLILREALADTGEEPVDADYRTDYYTRQISMLRDWQADGAIAPELDVEMLFLALLAVITLPAMLPQVVRLATGLAPGSDAFDTRWNGFLDELAASIAVSNGPGRSGERVA